MGYVIDGSLLTFVSAPLRVYSLGFGHAFQVSKTSCIGWFVRKGASNLRFRSEGGAPSSFWPRPRAPTRAPPPRLIVLDGFWPPSVTRTSALPKVLKRWNCITFCRLFERNPATVWTNDDMSPPPSVGGVVSTPPRSTSFVVSSSVRHWRSDDFGYSKSPVQLFLIDAGDRRSANRACTSLSICEGDFHTVVSKRA